ncbi:MAG: FliA/WhiG family RNA polymerase sigma factor [Halanaerobiaceae bacterium]|jgi:RNA polymerase sigma factor for flagellar operon FliA|nr:FliA/WhiG family RNA polymerase sigma factor [Halanaerobiaceae bacterium]
MNSRKVEEYSVWVDFKDNNNQDSFQELVLRYLPLVKYTVGRIKMMVPGFIEEDDLISYGILGLIDAIHKYDYKKGVLFETYASRRIRGEIIDNLRKLDWLPHSVRRDSKIIKDTAERLKKEKGRKATLDELAEACKISKERIQELKQQLHSSEWVSLYDEFDDIRIFDIISGNDDEPEKVYNSNLRVEILASAIERLNEDEKLVIALVYYEELTQKEIAEIMQLSAARVSQIHKKAVNRLRGMLVREREQLF